MNNVLKIKGGRVMNIITTMINHPIGTLIVVSTISGGVATIISAIKGNKK